MESLFMDIAGRRPEHVAKGALVHLLRKDPSLVAWLVACADRGSADLRNVVVTPEAAEGTHGWRADVVVEWTGGRMGVELKLGAPFTARQREALLEREVALIIAPHRDISTDLTNGTRVIEWRELLEHISASLDRGVAAASLLLEEATNSYSWYLETISAEVVIADAAAMFDNDKGERLERLEREWVQTYKFLLQIDAHLQSMIPSALRYDPTQSPLRPNKPDAHYGYYFGINASAVKKWWIGVNRDNGELALRLYEDEVNERVIWRLKETLKAADIAATILEIVRARN